MNEMLKALAPNPGRYPLTPKLTPQAEVALLARVLLRDGYDDHIAGHISLRQDDGTLFVTPWELAWDEVTEEDIIRVDDTGKVIEGDWNVTPAISLHLALYQARPDINVVMHNHSRWGTLWADMLEVPEVFDQTGAQVNGDIALYSDYDGTVDQAEEAVLAARALGDAKWALLANHGVLIVANDIRQAHLRAVTLEWRSRQAWHLKVCRAGKPMDAQQADQLGAMIDGNSFPFLWEAMVRRELRADPTIVLER